MKKYTVFFTGQLTYFANDEKQAREFAKKDLGLLHPKYKTIVSELRSMVEEEVIKVLEEE